MSLDEYEARYLDQYRRGSFETILAAARRRNVLVSLERHRHRRILEVGCGLEPLLESVADFDAFVVVEPAPRCAEHARERAANRPGVRVVQGYLEEVGDEVAGDTPYDFIVMSSVLHEVPDPARLLGAVRALCAPTTVVHVNVPNVRSFHRLLAQEAGLLRDLFEESEMERHFMRQTRFDLPVLLEVMKANGFDVFEHGSYFIKPFTHAQMDAILAAGILPPPVLSGLEGMSRHAPDLGAEIYANARTRPGQAEA